MLELGRFAWLRRVLFEDEPEERARVGSGASAGRPPHPPGMQSCGHCDGRVAPGSHRCPRCGNKLAGPESAATEDGSRTRPTIVLERLRPVSAGELSELQRLILVAALRSTKPADPAIHVLPTHSRREGEIKAGDQRLYGSRAVRAVEALLQAGYVARAEDLAYGLTEQGQRLASSLAAAAGTP